MRKSSLLGILWSFALGLVIVSASSSIAAVGSDSARLTAKERGCIVKDVDRLQVPFIGNQGQLADRSVLFHAQTFGGTFFVTGDGEIIYSIARSQSATPTAKRAAASRKVRVQTLTERLMGCSKKIPRGLDPSQAKVNYFIGSDRSKWTTDIPTYNVVTLGEVYKGIELSLKAYGKKVEKIFEVAPGADPTSIRIQLSGVNSLQVNDSGELEAKTGIGVIRFSSPVAYQEKYGKRFPVQVAYNVDGSTYGFEVTGHNPELPLIIDPCLVYSEALGGSSDDVAYAVATGPGSSVYLTGTTYSSNFPGPYAAQDTNAGTLDAFVTKLSASEDGTYEIDWSTYLGGSLDDYAFGMAVDGSGNAVVTGETWSPDFPTESAYEKKIGGEVDAYVARLNPSGVLDYSTYLGGGGGTEAGYAVALDTSGNAYVTGVTQASNFPVTPGAAFTRSNGKTNAFISKFGFSSPKMTLEASTFLGGNGDDAGYAVALDAGSVFVTGITDSADFWQEGTALSPGLSGLSDGFLTIFNTNLTVVTYSTYVGGNGEDACEGIALDDASNVYLTGTTSSSSGFPGCGGCVPSGTSDAFVFKLDGTLNPSSIYLGGTGEDAAYGIVLDPSTSSLYVAGRTNSGDLPQPDESAYAGGYDAFLTKLEFGETDFTVVSSSYFGGAGDDAAYGIALDSSGNACLAGSTHGLLGEETLDLDALVAVVSVADSDGDGIADACDNCPNVANGPLAGTCSTNQSRPCSEDSECGFLGYCSKNQEDWDGDGIGDACDSDDDNDSLDDTWEGQYGGEGGFSLDPYDTDSDDDGIPDGEEDFDEGGLPNTGEEDAGSNPYMKDTDGDRWTDLWEVQLLTSAIDPGDSPDPASVFAGGISVDKSSGDDVNLGNGANPVRSIHAAFDRIERFQLGSSNPVTISVAAGAYSIGDPEPDAPLMTSQNVIIEASGVIVDGAGSTYWTQGFVFSPLSADVTINGLSIVHFDEAVVFNTDGGCADLTGVTISSCRTGLQLAESYQLDVNLAGSDINGCETGIEICAEASGNTIRNGIIVDNSATAVRVSGGTGNQVVDANIVGPGAYGVRFGMGVEDFKVSGGTIGGLDVGIGFATDGMCLNVSGAVIQDCRAGIEFLENYMINVDLTGSTILGCDAGVLFRAGSSNNTILSGTAQGNDDGIRFEACFEAPDDNEIVGTNVIGSFENGIAIAAGSGNQLNNVSVSNNETGIYMGPESSGNIFVGGSVSSNDQNFVLDGSNNTVQDLTLHNFGEASGKGNHLIDVTLDGLSTERYGLLLEQGTEEIILQNVTIRNYDVGIGFAADASCLRFSGLTYIQNCRVGLDIRENYMLDIDLGGTVISGCETGIEIAAGSSNNTIRNGFVQENELDGILVDGCSESPDENQIIGTTVQNNNRNGIALLAGLGNEVIGCTVTGNNSTQMAGGYGGIAVMNGTGAVKRCRIYGNGCTGVYLDDSAVANISGNLIYNHPEGIRVALVTDVTVSSNTVTANDKGLVIGDGALPMVKYNILHGNGTGVDIFTDVSLEGDFNPANLVENNIGTVNQIDLPPSNLSVDPSFCVSDTSNCDPPFEDYSLQRTSLCIDGTTSAEPGIDVTGSSRPKGKSWDMGAIETSSFRDADDDALPDPWEEIYFGGLIDCELCGAADDYDGDGVSNLQEYLEGSEPNNPVYVRIDSPAASPAFTDDGSITISGVSVNANSITVTNGVTSGLGSWSATVSLADGGNMILVTATGTVDLTEYTATDSITIVNDSAIPTVTVLSPTNEGTYTTTSQFVTLSGLANDDTQVDSVSWEVVETGGTGTAVGRSSWVVGPVSLPELVGEPPESVTVTVTITATDIFGKSGSEDVIITRVPGATNVDEDLSFQGSEPSADDPLDVDGDGYLNDDEIACGSDPLCGDDSTDACASGLPAAPPNYGGMSYPTGHEKEGYLWPDCLNPDIDDDELPNWWEEEYFGGSPTAGVAGDDADLDGLTNLQEYQNGTNPNVAQTDAFTLTVTDLGGGDGLPEFGKTYRVQATWTGDQLETPVEAPAQAVFSLRMTSNYPGRAENDPDPVDMAGGGNYPAWYDYHGADFGLTATGSPDCNTVDCFSQGSVIVPDTGGGTYEVYLHSWDYGGRTKVLVTDPVSGNYLGQLWVPENSDKNGISSAWTAHGDLTGLDPNADTDAIAFDGSGYTAPLGDDFTHFEEYRGIIYTETVGGTLQHMRLNPFSKDLFVRGVGFYGDYVFEYGDAFAKAGITVHDTTGWGHDATEDGSFFVYFGEGSIAQITTDISGQYKKVIGSGTNWSGAWPRHEWEFKLDGIGGWTPIGYWSDTGDELGLDFEYGQVGSGSYGYRIRKPVPHINVLIIRHDPTGLFVSPDGHIRFVSASPPSQQNPLGTRYWRWATKGYAWCQTTANQSSMYGLAVTLETPLNSYFNDKPYEDRQTWSNGAWAGTDNLLNPLSLVEDQTDQMDPIDGVMGDGPDGNWDGDRRLPGFGGQLNPFDIDNDGRVELPLVTDPSTLNPLGQDTYEYNLSNVLKHTITHEMAHALAGPSHTNDPLCVMYRYSNNWGRHDHLSDYYKSLLRIHNIVR